MKIWMTNLTEIRHLKYQKTASFLLKCNQKKSWFFLLTVEIMPLSLPKQADAILLHTSRKILKSKIRVWFRVAFFWRPRGTKATITLKKHTHSFYIHHLKTLNENAMLDEQEVFLYKMLFWD